jgi:hypothetical protein
VRETSGILRKSKDDSSDSPQGVHLAVCVWRVLIQHSGLVGRIKKDSPENQ